MSSSKKARHRRSHYRVVTVERQAQTDAARVDEHITRDHAQPHRTADEQADREDLPVSTRPVAAVAGEADVVDAPTIILTPDMIAMLASPSMPKATPADSGYTYTPTTPTTPTAPDNNPATSVEDDATTLDAPTVVLEVGTILTPPSTHAVEVPTHTSDATVGSRSAMVDHSSLPPSASYARPGNSWPRPSRTAVPNAATSNTPTKRRTPNLDAPNDDFVRLREQRLARLQNEAREESDIAATLRQWWQGIQPGIDRVLGRAHRGGAHGARVTSYQTSAHMPVVKVRPLTEEHAPAIRRLSIAAQQIGARAQTAATPAIKTLHSRAEHAAQQLVDRIDEHLGGRPPMQNVLLGPGRMIVSFTASLSIHDAQSIIASVQGRALRRLVGYNAYLVLVPPGREARYAERFHTYHEVTGVHFGPQRPSASSTNTRPSGPVANSLPK